MLGAMRGEKGQSRIRNYIKSAHDPLTAEKLDRWSAWGTIWHVMLRMVQ